MCQEPGQIGCGTIFELTPHGRRYDERVLYNLGASENDGAVPLGGVVADQTGALYASTEFGSFGNFGTVFRRKRKADHKTNHSGISFFPALKSGEFLKFTRGLGVTHACLRGPGQIQAKEASGRGRDRLTPCRFARAED